MKTGYWLGVESFFSDLFFKSGISLNRIIREDTGRIGSNNAMRLIEESERQTEDCGENPILGNRADGELPH
ncbi:MAG: hypothetical protein ACUVQY_11440 [Thermoproteota archaeon]